ncbi:hypothetical protein GPECTOR_5g225 [Gonium pectorale]|uniref:Uncharacterized protein n=1 Tax=Gonium pectorale TaxID=33097 RepID=A0A150GWE4_GONPE|nr:hypothetical protein GPECTOR_5g225 [Gonium pectorale]|eukprot:KXZ54124.1 hypothetical protein GPECTOR_5g225 [Gonium pectorale]
MADYLQDDDRQEYIPANRLGRPLQRPLSAHANNRQFPPTAGAPLQKASTFGNGTPGLGKPRIQSAAQYRNRPSTASHAPTPVPAWGEPSSPRALYGMGVAGSSLAPGLFAGIEPPPVYQRPDHTRPVAFKEREALEDEVRKLRVALSGYKDQNRMLRTERQRLEEELGRYRTNLVKAEELLNAREKALSPTM